MAQNEDPQAPPPAGIESPAPGISIEDLKTHCLTCSLRELCLPVGLTVDEMQQVDALIVNRTALKKNEALYRAGEPFHALYAIRVGSLFQPEKRLLAITKAAEIWMSVRAGSGATAGVG